MSCCLSVVAAVVLCQAAGDPVPDPERAMKYLTQICQIGPRVAGSDGMARQRKLLTAFFTARGAKVTSQSWKVRHPITREWITLENLIVSWHPERARRVLVCCHYDTRPFPDRDPQDPRGRFVGANDGGSGVAVLMELAHHMPGLETAHGYGVDFVFFDAEELIYNEKTDPYFLGSTRFAQAYRADRRKKIRYDWGVLLDMVGDKDLLIPVERYSLQLAPRVTKSVYAAAKAAGVKEFVEVVDQWVRDDHLPLNQIAKIPTVDLIDFQYPHWHTTQDAPANCSGESLAKVARVLITWLKTMPGLAPGRR